jgi:hypothetical protein
VSGRFIPLRKNAEIQDRKYSVYTQNIVETQESETVKGKDALSTVDTTEIAEGTETTTEKDEDVQGIFFCLHDEDAKPMNLYFLITKLFHPKQRKKENIFLYIELVVKVFQFIEERDPNDATEFDDNEFVSAISEIEYDYDEDEEEDESGRSVPDGSLGQFLSRVDPDTPLGQFLNSVNTFKARIKTDINLLGRNLRLGLAFINVG